jgi:transcription elongation factor GreB
MGRWRPAPAKSSPYITSAGFEILRSELDALWIRRREVTLHLSAAAAEGDRSENAEYIYRKKELAGIDRRIRYLQKRLPELKIISTVPTNPEQVFFGAQVMLRLENGQEEQYRIVGPDEFDPSRNRISIDSPLARGLLKKTIDDEVVVTTPAGQTRYSIVDVSYQSSED